MKTLLEILFIWPYTIYWSITNFFNERYGAPGPQGGDRTLKPVLGSLLIYAIIATSIAAVLTQAQGWWIADSVLGVIFIIFSFIPMPEEDVADVEGNYFPKR